MLNKKKKLVLFMPFIGLGGVEKNLFIIANYLSKKFNNVNLCTISTKFKSKFDKKISFIVPKKKWSEKLNIRIKYFICLYVLYKYLSKNKNTVVLSFQANIYCIILCKLLNVKVIIRNNSSPFGWDHNFLKKKIYKFFVTKADAVIVNSLLFKNQMDKRFKIKTKCIFNPLNKEEILSLSKKNISEPFFKTKKSILKIINLGRLTDQKDHITLLKTINILRKKIQVRLLILGNGAELNKLNKFVFENKLNKNIKIKNFVNNPFPIMRQSDIFILSSKYEGLPNALLEAIVLKRFSISSDCPTGPREILNNGKGGMLFKIGNYHDLSKKILFYCKNKKLFRKKISFAFRNLKRFDYDKNLLKYYLLLNPFLVD